MVKVFGIELWESKGGSRGVVALFTVAGIRMVRLIHSHQ